MGLTDRLRKAAFGLALGTVLLSNPVNVEGGELEEKVVQESRPVLRVADRLWDRGEHDKALDLYEKLPSPRHVIEDVVEHVKYDERSRKTNFDELVFQKDVSKDKRKPVMVLFYSNDEELWRKFLGYQATSMFRRLAKQYGNEIDFVAYEGSILDSDPYKSFEKVKRRHGFNEFVDIHLYSPWDVLKEESKRNHSGIVRRIDILSSVPEDRKTLKGWINNFPKYWIEPNITKPNGTLTYRFNNSDNVSPINVR